MSRDYPWYEIAPDDGLEQGDLLMTCPVITPDPDLTFPGFQASDLTASDLRNLP